MLVKSILGGVFFDQRYRTMHSRAAENLATCIPPSVVAGTPEISYTNHCERHCFGFGHFRACRLIVE